MDIIIPTGNHGYLLPCTVERSEKNRPTICVDTYALVDGVLALVFLLLITVTVTLGIALANKVALLGGAGQVGIVDLRTVFDGLRVDALHPDYWWLYFMFAYTLLPTLIHMVIASLSVLLWIPRQTLQKWTQNWQAEQHKFDFPTFTAAGSYLAFITPLAFIMPLLLLGLFIWLLFGLGGGYTLGTWLLNSLQSLAAMLDASAGLPFP